MKILVLTDEQDDLLRNIINAASFKAWNEAQGGGVGCAAAKLAYSKEITALLDTEAPAGWKLVPGTPDAGMLDAADNEFDPTWRGCVKAIVRDAIAAAPSPPLREITG